MTLERLMVNHLRHECSVYEELFDWRCEAGRHEVRKVVYEAIRCAYPELDREVTRQLLFRGVILVHAS